MAANQTNRSRMPEIIEEAARIFHDKGYSATSIHEIAEGVGLLKGSLYHYIKTKEDLLYGVIHEAHAVALEATREKLTGLSTVDALRTFIYESLLFVARNPAKSSAFYRDARHLTGDHLESILALRRENEELLEDLISVAQDKGLARNDKEPRLLALAVLGLITSLVNWYHPSGAWHPAEVAHHYTDLAFSALAIAEHRDG